MSNRLVYVPQETSIQQLEGVDFGAPLRIVTRSPRHVLFWRKGHTAWSSRGQQSYVPGCLFLVPRDPSFMSHPTYERVWEPDIPRQIFAYYVLEYPAVIEKLIKYLDSEAIAACAEAVKTRQTLLIDGGAGQLLPPGCRGEAYREWRDRGGGFLVLPEGTTEHDAARHKLGWKP